MGPVGRFCL